MNGFIQVESQKGVGSTFRFSVCLGEPSQDEALQYLFAKPWLASSDSPLPNSISHPRFIQALCESPPQFLSNRGTSYSRFNHVLIVEDNLINQKIVSKYLKRLGYIPSVVSNGKEAVDLIQESLRITSSMSDSSDLKSVDCDVCDGEISIDRGLKTTTLNGKVVHFDMIIMDIEMPVMVCFFLGISFIFLYCHGIKFCVLEGWFTSFKDNQRIGTAVTGFLCCFVPIPEFVPQSKCIILSSIELAFLHYFNLFEFWPHFFSSYSNCEE